MREEKRLADTSCLMFVLNFVILLYYILVCSLTTNRICQSYSAYAFLSEIGFLPQYPWVMPVVSLTLYAGLVWISYRKNAQSGFVPGRVLSVTLEIVLGLGIMYSLNFYYSGIALLVLADLVNYVRSGRSRVALMVVLIVIFTLFRYEVLSENGTMVPFSSYLNFYDSAGKGYLIAVESVLVSMNILLFMYYMVQLFTGQIAENERIRTLYDQLKNANIKLQEYTVELERMTEIRERNRLAREIHDTLGHTLTGITMAADAALALFDAVPQEAKKRLEAVARSAREGLADVRQSIKALRPDALEHNSLEQALQAMISGFAETAAIKVTVQQEAGDLYFARDEEDTIYRIIQEGMTNAVRHGRADEITITLRQHENMLEIGIRDNGTGCESVSEGFGLRHMKERLDLLSGSMTYGNRRDDPEDGHEGFYVIASLPVRRIRRGENQ